MANKTCLDRIEAAYASNTSPTYADLQEGLAQLLNENTMLNKVMASMTKDMARLVAPRITQQADEVVLATLDEFIQRRAIMKPRVEGLH